MLFQCYLSVMVISSGHLKLKDARIFRNVQSVKNPVKLLAWPIQMGLKSQTGFGNYYITPPPHKTNPVQTGMNTIQSNCKKACF